MTTSADVRNEVTQRLKVTSLLYALAMVVILFVLNALRWNLSSTMDLSFLLVAFAAAFLIIYAGTVALLVLRGPLARPLGEGLYMLAPAVCVSIFGAMRPAQFPEAFSWLALPSLAAGMAVSSGVVMRKSPSWPLVRSGGLALLGAAVLLGTTGAGPVGGAVGKAFLLSGALSLLAFTEHHADSRLRKVGTFFASDLRTGLATAGAVVLFLYLDVVRTELVDSNTAAMLEWSAVALLVLALAMVLHRGLRPVEEDIDWSTPLMTIKDREGDLVRATGAVKAFVDRGEREDLLIMMVATLRANRVPDEEIARIIQGLVRYQPREAPLALAWNHEANRRDERWKRQRLITDALNEAAKISGPDAAGERR